MRLLLLPGGGQTGGDGDREPRHTRVRDTTKYIYIYVYMYSSSAPPSGAGGHCSLHPPAPVTPTLSPCPQAGSGGDRDSFPAPAAPKGPLSRFAPHPQLLPLWWGAGGGDWGAASQSFDQGCAQAPPTQRDPPSCHPWLGVQPGRIGGAGQCLNELQPLPKPIQGVQTPTDPPKNFISLPLSSSLASRRPQKPPRPASTSSITAAAPPRRWGERKPPAPATGRS